MMNIFTLKIVLSLEISIQISEEAEAPQTVHGGICGAVTFTIMLILLVGEMSLWKRFSNIVKN